MLYVYRGIMGTNHKGGNMKQISYDPLYLMDQNPDLSREEAHKVMRRERDKDLRQARIEGQKVYGWTLRNQLRPYRGLGQPDGSVRHVYYISVMD